MTHSEVRAIFKSYMKVKSGDKAHAVLSASGSERWLGCPGSVRLSEGISGVDTEWSIAGNQTHTLLQFILEQGTLLLDHPEAKAFKKFINYSLEQLTTVMVVVIYVQAERRRMFRETGIRPHLLIEQKVKLEGVGFGTADIILYQPFGLLHIIDFKNGRSVVEPENNTQGLYYACAVADLYGWDFSECWITIGQPNAHHKKGPIRTWKTTPKRLEEARAVFLIGAARTKSPTAKLVMDTKWCYFCPANNKVQPKCPVQKNKKTQKLVERFRR